MAIIRVWAAKPYPQCSGDCGLALARVRTRMMISVAEPDPLRAFSIQGLEFCSGHDTQCRQPSRDEIDGIVEPRGGTTEVPIRSLTVANHGIECIDRFVRH